MPMTIANVEMAKAWEEEGEHWSEHADRYDAAGVAIWTRFLDAGLIEVTDRVLDIGCGTGQSTRDAARAASSGSALGVDLSSRMLDLARRRGEAEGLTNVEFLLADAQVHPFEPEGFDIAISRFGAMFFADRDAAFRNFAAALRTGGRLAVLTWRGFAENEWVRLIRDTLAAGRPLPDPPSGSPGPFGLADADGVGAALAGAGFGDIDLAPVNGPMCFGADADDALAFMSSGGIVKGLTETLEEPVRRQVLADLRQLLADHASADGVCFDSAAWLITARRV